MTLRIPLNTLAISLGLTGLADTWASAGSDLHWAPGIAEGFWVLAAAAWVATIAAHAIRGARTSETLLSQLRHPVQGPIAAIWPIVSMALGANLTRFWPLGGRVLIIASIVVSALFAGWLLARLMNGQLKLESVHGGYFLPLAAASFVAAAVLPVAGSRTAAIGCFALGVFFWILTFALLFARLAFRAPLAPPLTPTLAILAAPPAVAGVAWFAIEGDRPSVGYWLAASTVLMLLVQAALLPRYVKLPFTLGFWSFTFPFAYTGVYAIEWLEALKPTGWQAMDIAVLVLVTVLIVAIAVKSVGLFFGNRSRRYLTPEGELRAADDRIR